MTADPRAVEIIAAELARHTLGLGNTCACGRTAGVEDDLALPEWDQHLASASAAALTAAGWSLLPPGGQTRDLMRDMELVAAQLDRTARGRSILRDLTSTHVADAYHDAAMRVREALATHRPPSDAPEVDRG